MYVDIKFVCGDKQTTEVYDVEGYQDLLPLAFANYKKLEHDNPGKGITVIVIEGTAEEKGRWRPFKRVEDELMQNQLMADFKVLSEAVDGLTAGTIGHYQEDAEDEAFEALDSI